MTPGPNPRGGVVALVGPTGAGKSAIALEVAEDTGAEIVAIDAFTVYRGMDIGTAKPTAAQRRRVPHHLVDVLDPAQDATVQWFQQAAREAIAVVHRRGRVALLVGGSGLYFRAVVDPLEFPPTDPDMRARVASRFAGRAAAAHDELARVDPAAAKRIDRDNLRRAVRALEVWELTGRPFSAWQRAWGAYESVYSRLRVLGVDRPRPELAERITGRVHGMVEGGLLDECRRLLEREAGLSRTARQAIGYAEAFEHLRGTLTLDEAIARTIQRTRRFAARQQRWFRRDPRVQWEAPGDVAQQLRDAVGWPGDDSGSGAARS